MSSNYSIILDGTIKTFRKFDQDEYFKYAECGAGNIFELHTDFGIFRFLSTNDRADRTTYMILHFTDGDKPDGYYTMEPIDYLDLVHMWINYNHRDNMYCLEYLEHWLYHMVQGQ